MNKAVEIVKGFDIGSMDVVKESAVGFEFEVTHPHTGKPLGGFLTIVGDESDIVRNHIRAKLAELRMLQQAAKRRNEEYESTFDDFDRDATESATVRVIGWRGWMENGSEIPFSKEAVAALMNKHKWIRPQVMKKAGDLGNFIK